MESIISSHRFLGTVQRTLKKTIGSMPRVSQREKLVIIPLLALSSLFCAGPVDNLGDGDFPVQGPKALVVLSDYQTGSYSLVDLDTFKTKNLVQVIHQDAVCKYDPITRRMFIVERLGADAVALVSETGGWGIEKEYSIAPPPGANPQDIAIVSRDKAYVPLYQAPLMVVVNPLNGERIGTIDLSEYADDDGLPEAAWALYVNGLVFVVLQRLDSRNSFEPTDYSMVVVIDPKVDRIIKEIRLSATNPFGKPRYSDAMGGIVIGEAGRFGVLDGGIEVVDVHSLEAGGLIVTEQAMGGDLVDAVIATPDKGYAVIGEPRGQGVSSTKVVSFNPATGKQTDVLDQANTWKHSFLELEPGGSRLWITERGRTEQGIRIFDTSSDCEITAKPIDLGLDPFMLCFFQKAGAQQ
ncbi:MAG: hypothetical protein GXP49_04645 [Deltaproteobacteria bacterium]|nr:hypothetical protein [Deltaproteobacteria bacterium]